MSRSALRDLPEGSVRRPDGRALTWVEFGAPDGDPVLYHHGTPGCGAEAVILHDAAARADVRVIAVNRPGLAGSSFLPDRSLADWPADAAAVLDDLGLGSVPVIGFSGGGPYALVCGARAPERFPVVAVVSGATPVDGPGALAAMSASDRHLTLLSLRAPALGRAFLAALGLGARLAPNVALRTWKAELPAADRRELSDFGVAPVDVMHFFVDAMRHGPGGALHDYLALSLPWPFTPAEVAVPVHWWHGADDTTVALPGARRLVEQLPTGHLTVVPDAGHLLLRSRGTEILGRLTGR